MDPDLAPAKFGGAAPPGKERTHVVGMYAFDERYPPNSKFKIAGLDGLGGRAFGHRLRHSGYESQSCQHLVGKFACI